MIDGPDTDWARYFQGRKVEYCVPWPGGMILMVVILVLVILWSWWGGDLGGGDLGGFDLGGDDPGGMILEEYDPGGDDVNIIL